MPRMPVSNWLLNLMLNEPVVHPVTSPFPEARQPLEPPVELAEAEIRWGKPGRFDYDPRQTPRIRYKVNIKWPSGDDEEEKEEERIPVLEYNEVPNTRVEKTHTIPAENDPDVTMDVTYITSFTVEGPDSLLNPTTVHKKINLIDPHSS